LPLANTGRILTAKHNTPQLICRIIYARIYSFDTAHIEH
jgi:hypothetical protein